MVMRELASGVGPARRQHNVAAHRQSFEPGIAVDLQDTAETLEVGGGLLRLRRNLRWGVCVCPFAGKSTMPWIVDDLRWSPDQGLASNP